MIFSLHCFAFLRYRLPDPWKHLSDYIFRPDVIVFGGPINIGHDCINKRRVVHQFLSNVSICHVRKVILFYEGHQGIHQFFA